MFDTNAIRRRIKTLWCGFKWHKHGNGTYTEYRSMDDVCEERWLCLRCGWHGPWYFVTEATESRKCKLIWKRLSYLQGATQCTI